MPKRHIAVYQRKQYTRVRESWCEWTLVEACSHHDPHHGAYATRHRSARASHNRALVDRGFTHMPMSGCYGRGVAGARPSRQPTPVRPTPMHEAC